MPWHLASPMLSAMSCVCIIEWFISETFIGDEVPASWQALSEPIEHALWRVGAQFYYRYNLASKKQKECKTKYDDAVAQEDMPKRVVAGAKRAANNADAALALIEGQNLYDLWFDACSGQMYGAAWHKKHVKMDQQTGRCTCTVVKGKKDVTRAIFNMWSFASRVSCLYVIQQPGQCPPPPNLTNPPNTPIRLRGWGAFTLPC